MKTYLITGASKGIGFHLVKKIILEGHRVFAIVRTDDDAFSLINEIPNEELIPIVCDLSSDRAEYEISSALKEHSSEIDCLINNAGKGGKGPELEIVDTKLILELFINNTLSALKTTKASLPYFTKTNSPLILNIISRFALADQLLKTKLSVSYPYALSKSALHTCTILFSKDKSLNNIISLSVDPGPTKTRMGREDAVHSPELVAEKIFNLTLQNNSHLNGRAIDIHSMEELK